MRLRPNQHMARLVVAISSVCSPWWACAQSGATAPDRPAIEVQALAKLPVEAFAALPALRLLTLSPDGEHLAAVMNREGQSVLMTARLDGSEMRGLMELDNGKFQFNWLHWANNKRLLVGFKFPAIRPGAATVETRLMAMDLDGSQVVNLVPPNRDRAIEISQIQDDVVDFLPDDGQNILLALMEDQSVNAPGIYKVNIHTGKRELVFWPRRFIWDWITDRQHRVRVGTRREKDEVQIVACDPDGGNWRPLWSFKAYDAGSVYPLAFGKNPQKLYVQASHQGRDAVFLAHLDQLDADGHPRLELRESSPTHDIRGSLIISPQSGEVIGISHFDEGRADEAFWTESLRELAKAVDQGLPGRVNRIYGFNADESRYVIRSSANGIPDQVYVGDRREGKINFLADIYPGLPAERMVGKKFVMLKARDGLELRAYLTRPKGSNAPGPLVLLPHGGPISRDNLDFDTWTEFLASRGYSVLQVNFRGSDGYGNDLRQAGMKRWGLEMQDDLTDAVKWAVDQQIADPKRICIVGASYGGYAALMGAVKTPDLYRCAMSFAGVTNLIDLSRHEASYINGQSMTDRSIGNYWRDRSQLKATSPTEHVQDIKVPVLLMHGTADRSVPYDQSQKMADALKAAGKKFQFVTLTDGDHHLSRQRDRLRFFTELETFLNDNIGLAATPAKP